MCLALKAHKIPQGRLLELGTRAADPLGSDVIVATAAVRNEFGRRLSSVYAPTVIATFGSGSLRISVRAIAPDGAAAYRAALAKDLLDRKASGAQLLQSPLILASAEARKQLAAGQVDLRLLYTIADMAAQPPVDAQHPVDIVAFGDSAPGASAGIPLRSADLTERNGAARSSRVRSMLAHLRALGGPPYPYGRATIVRLAGGRTVLRIEFAAAEPARPGHCQDPVINRNEPLHWCRSENSANAHLLGERDSSFSYAVVRPGGIACGCDDAGTVRRLLGGQPRHP